MFTEKKGKRTGDETKGKTDNDLEDKVEKLAFGSVLDAPVGEEVSAKDTLAVSVHAHQT
jgi:hypothetical protein